MLEPKLKLFKQRLLRAHTSLGIFLSLFMYVCLFFGIFAIFLPFIQVWEKPSRHFEVKNTKEINYSSIIDTVISKPDFPKNNIRVKLPGYKNDPALRISHQFIEEEIYNPSTGIKQENENKQSKLAFFLNQMHYGQFFSIFGRLFFGFVAVGVMFLIVGGLLLLVYIKFQKNGKNQKSTFSKLHRNLFILTCIPLFLITLTGALMNVGFKGAAPLASYISKGEKNNVFSLVRPVLMPKEKSVKRANINVKMLSIKVLLKKAKKINPQLNIEELKLINWKDKTARIEFLGYNPYKPFLNGIYNRPKIILSAVDASLIKNIKVLDRSWSVLLTDSLYFLHLLYGVDIFTKVFVSILMLLSCFAIAFGVMHYLEKQAKIFDEKIPFYHGLGKFSLALMIGVLPATALLFNLQWLLPFDMNNRIFVQQALFFNLWLATLTWSFYRLSSYKAAKEFLYLAGILFILAPLVHFKSSGFSALDLYEKNMTSILSVDIVLTLLGLILLIISYKLPKTRKESQYFWNKKHQGLSNEE